MRTWEQIQADVTTIGWERLAEDGVTWIECEESDDAFPILKTPPDFFDGLTQDVARIKGETNG